MVNPLLTVIVPVYGVEKYLDRCMDSIVNQTYRNLEIIMVDDKSPDGSPQMCDRWAELDSRVKVVHKTVNEGLGYARNTGMQHATGDFISFVDSDDYLDLDIYRKMIETALERGADIVYMGLKRQQPDGAFSTIAVDAEIEYDGDMKKHILEYIPGATPSPYLISVCIGLFRREVVKSNLFISEREAVSEDFDWTLRAILGSKKVCRIPSVGYYYCYNNASISHSYNYNDINRIIRSGEIIRDILKSAGAESLSGTYLFLRLLNYQRFDIFGYRMKIKEIRHAVGIIMRNDRYFELLSFNPPKLSRWALRMMYRVQRTRCVTLNLLYGWFDRNVVCDKLGIPRLFKKKKI